MGNRASSAIAAGYKEWISVRRGGDLGISAAFMISYDLFQLLLISAAGDSRVT
jgi:hypothetical protein